MVKKELTSVELQELSAKERQVMFAEEQQAVEMAVVAAVADLVALCFPL